MAIFPEGTTHDRLQLAPIRTGAARIALGARAAGVEGITIVPVGILYESKFKLRSRALLRIGEPIHLDDAVASLVAGRTAGGEEDHEAVRALTDRVAAHLVAASPRFASVFEWQRLAYASEVALRRPDRPVSLVGAGGPRAGGRRWPTGACRRGRRRHRHPPPQPVGHPHHR